MAETIMANVLLGDIKGLHPAYRRRVARLMGIGPAIDPRHLDPERTIELITEQLRVTQDSDGLWCVGPWVLYRLVSRRSELHDRHVNLVAVPAEEGTIVRLAHHDRDLYIATCPGRSASKQCGQAYRQHTLELKSLLPGIETARDLSQVLQIARSSLYARGSGTQMIHPIEGAAEAPAFFPRRENNEMEAVEDDRN